MLITLFGWDLSVKLSRHVDSEWKERVVRRVNAHFEHSMYRYSKIEHIKFVRKLGFMFPDNSSYEKYEGNLLGLSDSKRFVEENWPEL